MDITVLVAKVLGIYLIVAGIFLIARGKSVPHMLRDFFDHPAITFLTGVILIFLTSMYLLQYNIWDGTWRTLITAIAWITGVKGLFYIFAPQTLNALAIQKFRAFFGVYGVLALAAGAYLLTLG